MPASLTLLGTVGGHNEADLRPPALPLRTAPASLRKRIWGRRSGPTAAAP